MRWPRCGTAPPLRRSGGTHDGPAARLRAAAGAARTAQPAPIVVAVAVDHAAAAAPRISPDAAVVRHHAEGRYAGAHAMVAHIAAADADRFGDRGRCWTDVEPVGRDIRRRRAAGPADRRWLRAGGDMAGPAAPGGWVYS